MEQSIEVGTPSREEIHDTQIRPLMAEVIKIAEEHNIPLLVVMQLSDDGLVSTSCMVGDGVKVDEYFRLLIKIALHGIEHKAEGSVH